MAEIQELVGVGEKKISMVCLTQGYLSSEFTTQSDKLQKSFNPSFKPG